MVQIALGSIYIHNYLLGNQEKGEERKGNLYFSYPFPFILNSPQPSWLLYDYDYARKRRVQSIGADSFLVKSKIVSLYITF